MTIPIQKLQQRLLFDLNIPQSLHNAKIQFKAMKVTVKKNIKNAWKLCTEHLHQCELQAVENMDKQTEKIIKRIKKAEELTKFEEAKMASEQLMKALEAET